MRIICPFTLPRESGFLEKQFEQIGVRINRQTMCNWQEGAYEKLDPLLLLLRHTVKEGIFMTMDETRAQVMRYDRLSRRRSELN